MPKADAAAKPVKNHQLDIKPLIPQRSSQDAFGALDEEVEYFKALFYGPEGSGKTSAAATLANSGPVLFINAEGGAKKRALSNLGVKTENISTWPAKRGDVITYRGLEEVYEIIKADLDRDIDSWAGIIIDSATDVVQALTDQASDNRIVKARKRNVEIDEVDEFFTDVSDYGVMTKMFTDLLRKFRDLPTHVIYTALERQDLNKATGFKEYGPAVTPAVGVSLLGYVDLVLAFKAADEDQPFRAITKGAKLYRCKDRFGILPAVMAAPSIERIIAYANGEFDETPDVLQEQIKAPRSGKKLKTTKTPTPAPAVVASKKNEEE